MMDQLMGLRRADAAIVGGGLTGLLLGSSLAQEGMQVAVIDAGSGECSVSSATATVHCAPVYARIKAAHGLEAARLYASGLRAQLHALTESPLPYVRQTAVYAYAASEAELPLLEEQHELLTQLHLPVSVAPDAGGCPFPVELSLAAQGQALVDMGRWLTALRREIRRQGGRVYTHSRVTTLEGSRACTAQGCVHAPLIILTTGKPLGLRNKRLLALLESRTTVRCTLTGSAPLHNAQQSVEEGGLSLCPTALGAIAAWDAGRTGMRQQREQRLSLRLPDWQHGEMHCTQEVFPADGLPIIGAMPDSRVLCASGFGGCGVLGAMHAASLLSRRILGRALPEDALYAPERKLPGRIIHPQMRRITAIYARNMLRRSAPSCAHCACRMRYSSPADRWECPYCGSAYTMLGHALCGPGMLSAQVSPRQRPVL